jgi:hypothetical protein
VNPTARTIVKTLLRPVYQPPRVAFQYVRARRIVRSYADNYRAAQAAYRAAGLQPAMAIPSLDRLGVRVVAPGEPNGVVTLPEGYAEMVARVAGDVDRRFAASANCLFMPRVDRGSLPALTADVPAIRDRDVISLQLRDAAAADGVRELSDALIPELERALFGSFAIVDKVYVYRNLVTRQAEQVSWLWHYDNHPTEVVKAMVYLTDVGDTNAPFEYMRRKDTGEPYMFTPLPLLGHSRVATATVDRHIAEGYEAFKATGPKGTLLVFDDNVLHRATFAREGHRDVLVFQLRPATFHPEPRLDARWTGSFEHDDFNHDANDYQVRVKRTKISG